jgi:hypothetical protein
MSRGARLSLLLAGSVAAAADGDYSMLLKARAIIDPEPAEAGSMFLPPESAEKYGKAANLLKGAEESCGVDASGERARGIIHTFREQYESMHELLSKTDAQIDVKKLDKTLAKAERKLKLATEQEEDDTLVPKAELAARKANKEALQAAIDKTKDDIHAANVARNLREPKRVPQLHSLASVASRLQGKEYPPLIAATAKLKVLSKAPFVLTIDDWLGTATNTAFKALPATVANLSAPSERGGDPSRLVAAAEDIAESYAEPGKARLCLPLKEDGTVEQAFLNAIDGLVAEQRKLSSADACNGTLALVSEKPEDWDAEEDGEWSGEFNSAADRYPAGAQGGCGPLTPAINSLLVGSSSTFITTSTHAHVDIVDAAISAAAGFEGFDVEALARELLEGRTSRVDPDATPPEDWDAEEDGEWEAPTLEAKDDIALLAAALEKPDYAGLHDAYVFSSSPEALVLRAGKGVGLPAELQCPGQGDGGAPPAIVAVLYASEPSKQQAGGGELSFPALGINVAPKLGRLVLYSTTLDDGGCDPASVSSLSPMPQTPSSASAAGGDGDLLLLRKRFHTSRFFSRERANSEGPQRGPPTVVCENATAPVVKGKGTDKGNKGGAGSLPGACHSLGGHVGAERGDAVLKLRGAQGDHRHCHPPNTEGPCNKKDGYMPPPKEKKKPPTKPPAEPMSAEAAATAQRRPPPPPGGAPPPISH